MFPSKPLPAKDWPLVTFVFPLQLNPNSGNISLVYLINFFIFSNVVDASIWMIQFMKAMRDEKGEMVRHAHLLGFFRRICKLLYLRTKPIFVFDGGTPALKRRTVIARRRQRENAQAKIRKTAEKLLLNQVRYLTIFTIYSLNSIFLCFCCLV